MKRIIHIWAFDLDNTTQEMIKMFQILNSYAGLADSSI